MLDIPIRPFPGCEITINLDCCYYSSFKSTFDCLQLLSNITYWFRHVFFAHFATERWLLSLNRVHGELKRTVYLTSISIPCVCKIDLLPLDNVDIHLCNSTSRVELDVKEDSKWILVAYGATHCRCGGKYSFHQSWFKAI